MAFAEDDVEDFMTDLCTRLERFESYMVSSAIWQDRVSTKINALEDRVRALEQEQKTLYQRLEQKIASSVKTSVHREAKHLQERLTRLHDWIGAVRDEFRRGSHVSRITSGTVTPTGSFRQLPDLPTHPNSRKNLD